MHAEWCALLYVGVRRVGYVLRWLSIVAHHWMCCSARSFCLEAKGSSGSSIFGLDDLVYVNWLLTVLVQTANAYIYRRMGLQVLGSDVATIGLIHMGEFYIIPGLAISTILDYLR